MQAVNARGQVVTACFMHETNTFSSIPTTQAEFRNGGVLWLEGDDVAQGVAGTNTESCGFVEAAVEFGWDLTLTVHGEANPGGKVSDACFDEFSGAIVAAIERVKVEQGRVNGVLLALHGAMVTESHDDGEGELLRRIRRVLGTSSAMNGDDVPIVVTLDLHANVSDEMVQFSSALISYRT
jgi:microcystin degradation protein MlrC